MKKNLKKVIRKPQLPTPQADGSGLTDTMITNFGVKDRGCLPIMSSSTKTQAQTQQLLLGPGKGTTSITSLQTDYGAYITLLCSASGICCSTGLCNGSNTLFLYTKNDVFTIFLSFLALIKGF